MKTLWKSAIWGVATVAALGGMFAAAHLRSTRMSRWLTNGADIRVRQSEAASRQVLWRPAQPVAGAVNSSADEYEPRVSADGTVMVLVRGKPGSNADLFSSRWTPEGWTAPAAIAEINTPADELGPELSADGTSLYFYSDRSGGLGGYDLWVSRSTPSGWGPPVNLGPAVNSPDNEYGPALAPDGATLYFASNRPRPQEPTPQRDAWPATVRQTRDRHDYDLYAARLGSSSFEQATAVVGVNSPADEGSPAISPAGDFLYFASDRPGGMGGFDLYRVRLTSSFFPGDTPAVENLGPSVNSSANDLDPALSWDGFRLHFSSSRPLANSTAQASAPPSASSEHVVDYNVWTTTSREVYSVSDGPTLAESMREFLDRVWPWLLTLIAACFLAWLLARTARSPQWRARLKRLSLLSQCMLASVAIHLLIVSLLALWKVGTQISNMLAEQGAGGGTRVVLASSGAGSDAAGLIRGSVSSAPEFSADIQLPRAALERPDVDVSMTRTDAAPTRIPGSASHDIAISVETAAPSTTIVTREASLPDAPTITASTPTDTSERESATERSRDTSLALAPSHANLSITADPKSERATIAPTPTSSAAPAPSLRLEATDSPASASRATAAAAPSSTPPAPSNALNVSTPGDAGTPDATSEPTSPAATPRIAAAAGPLVVPGASRSAPAIVNPGQTSLATSGATQPLSAIPLVGTPSGLASQSTNVVQTSAPPTTAGSTVAVRGPADHAERETAPEITSPTALPGAITHSGRAGLAVDTKIGSGRAEVAPSTSTASRSGSSSTVDLFDAPANATVGHSSVPAAASALPGAPNSRIAVATPSAGSAPTDAARDSEGEPGQPSLRTNTHTRPALGGAGTGPSAPPAGTVRVDPASSASRSQGESSPVSVDTGAADTTSGIASQGPTAGLPQLPAANLSPGVALKLPADEPVPTPVEKFEQRAPEVRNDVLEKMGGSEETERAVGLALEWFKRHQESDGRWTGRTFDSRCKECDGPADFDSDAAMTGMALLCYLGAGHTHTKDGPYQGVVKPAVEWLLARQDPTGDLRRGETMYSQAIASVALCEAFAMTQDPRLGVAARRAIGFMTRETARSDQRRADETSVLGWQVMAMESARRAGIQVPSTTFDAAKEWLDYVSTKRSPGMYAYQRGGEPSAAMTAEAMFVQQLLGHSKDEPRMRESAHFILRTPPRWKDGAFTYYWYYATLALFQHQGDAWKTWNEALVPELTSHQRQHGGAAGSWDPQDAWSKMGGRIYQTAVCTLSLEVYYRYKPSASRGNDVGKTPLAR